LEKGKISGGQGDSHDGNAEMDIKELVNKLCCCSAPTGTIQDKDRQEKKGAVPFSRAEQQTA
jgi:hypothetical protein